MPKKKPQIATYVFFHSETTGLPLREKNETKIIEYCFVATLRKDLEAAPYGQTPPVIGKINSFLNPEKSVSRAVTGMTGLTKKKLSKEPTFGQKFESINAFLEALPAPVCLVSHYGNKFDFRILLAECNDVSVSLPANLCCVDSWLGFKGLLMGTGINYSNLELSRSSFTNLETPQSSSVNILKMPQSPVKNMIKPSSSVPATPVGSEIENISDLDATSSFETTMDDQIDSEEEVCGEIIIDGASTSEIDIENQKPFNGLNTNKMSSETENVINKKLCSAHSYAETEIECFGLKSVYKRLLNKEPESTHRAEADCLMMMHCVVALKKDFLPWADKNHQLLTKIKPLKRGQYYWNGRYRTYR